MDVLKSVTVDWRRSLIINASVDDELVRQLTPRILALRQESNDPITVGIDSPGGSLASLDVLMGLLTCPDQDGLRPQIITVAINRAYSAAANFLAFGDYAVAMRHAQILYHDVRFGGMEDVTPEKARDAAKSLQDANDAFALRLAHRVIGRLIWVYIDRQTDFRRVREEYSGIHKMWSEIISLYVKDSDGFESVDLASFATVLWVRLSRQNDSLIVNVMGRLKKWINLNYIAKNTAKAYREKGSRIVGLLDGLRHLHINLSGKPEHFKASEDGLKLFLSLLVSDISSTETDKVDFHKVVERAHREFNVLNSMNDMKHIKYASDLMLGHRFVFFGSNFDEKSEEEKSAIISRATPYATLLWQFCVVLCRELFEGEHILTPSDARILGLVDEVSGDGSIQSLRNFRVERLKSQAAEDAKKVS